MTKNSTYLGLDVGSVRIGTALADTGVQIAIPYDVIAVDGSEIETIARLVLDHEVSTVVIGYPRNQAGEATPQTDFVETFADKLKDIADNIVFQDESVTSIIAEDRLKSRGKPYTKGDIDAEAAAIILQDYLSLSS